MSTLYEWRHLRNDNGKVYAALFRDDDGRMLAEVYARHGVFVCVLDGDPVKEFGAYDTEENARYAVDVEVDRLEAADRKRGGAS